MVTRIPARMIETTGVTAGSYSAADITVNSAGQVTSASTSSVASSGGGPKITSIVVTDSSYTNIDDTAVGLSGGYIKITGTGFVSGCSIIIGSLVATSVSFINSTEVRAQVPAQSAGTYTVYLSNSDGGVAIRVNGLNYSSTPTWTTTSPLAGAMKNTNISLQLAATSNSTVTYTLQAGSSLPSGLTLSSSGLITGTTPDIANDTTYNFTVVATDLENQDTPQAFQITINANDLYYEYVTLHLPGTGTNLANNNTFSDASTNNFIITRNGNTTQGTFSPFSQTGWGNYFDGSGDYLTATKNAAYEIGSGDFTVEAWVFPTANGALYNSGILSYGANTSTNGWLFGITGTNFGGTLNRVMFEYNYDGTLYLSTSAVTLNAWNHIAVSRSGSNIYVFLNGNLQTTTSTSKTANTNAGDVSVIGSESYSPSDANRIYTGYISNLRLVKGGALYTSNFTPSTTPLTTTVSSGTVSLLTCQSNRFIDNSTNNFTITRNGDTRVVAFSPFNPAVSYDPAIHGGSVYFDGTGDYLSLPASTNLNIAQDQPFTLEYWIYMMGNYAQPFSSWNGQGSSSQYNVSGGSGIYLPGLGGGWGATKIFWYNGQWGAWETGKTCTVDIGKYQWVHLAWTRDSSNVWRLYINGVSQTVGTYISTGAPWSDNLAMNFGSLGYGIGGLSNIIPDPCYISGLKFVVGTALYTDASFTLPTAPPEVTTNTQVLTKFNNAGILDVTGKNVLETVGDAKISTAQSKWGGSSMLFDGTGDILSSPANQNYVFGGDFTVEGWVYIDSTMASSRPDNLKTFIFVGWNTGNTPQFYVYGTTSTAGVGLGYFDGTNAWDVAATVPKDQWAHLAYVRTGSALYGFVNGTRYTINASISATVGSANTLVVGGNPSQSSSYYSYLKGYIQDLRVTKGIARYTANFTPPTAAFPTL